MDILQESTKNSLSKVSFFNHVFSTTEQSKAEFMNVLQYSFLSVIPVVLMNKSIQRFIPDADEDASTIELLAEIVIQIIIIIIGIVIIHRVITFVPTYSGYTYEPFILTNAILIFLVITLSIQTKLGLKTNILFNRLTDALFGSNSGGSSAPVKMTTTSMHQPSQADRMNENPAGMFPPPPVVTTNNAMSGNPAVSNSFPTSEYTAGSGGGTAALYEGPVAANGALGGGSAFGSLF